jgi:hypothetical protein
MKIIIAPTRGTRLVIRPVPFFLFAGLTRRRGERGESRINGNNCFGIHKDFLIVRAGKAPGEK